MNFRYILANIIVLTLMVGCTQRDEGVGSVSEPEVVPVENRQFGILSDGYRIEHSEIKQGQTIGSILNSYGRTPLDVARLDVAAKDVFPLRDIRAGQSFAAFIKSDSLGAERMDYMVYEQNALDYVVFDLLNPDSIVVYKGQKPSTVRRMKRSAKIESSLWGAIMEANLPYALAAEMEDIYQWTVDFFGIQKGDSFTVIYDEKFVDDTVSIGIGQIWGAEFNQGERRYYAIPFVQGDRLQYWEEDGASLRKQMLKAPLKFSRISSKFTYARLHPIYKVYRAHTGVDYAAPMGTPVHSVADGVVTFKGWGGGGGNTLKIKHAGQITTGYMHLRGYAKGIYQGAHVKQGQTIGYVGSTGASTGPHLDYRVWKGSTPIDPLKIPQKPTEPISAENKSAFEQVKARVIAELDGDVLESQKLKSFDVSAAENESVSPVIGSSFLK